MKRTTPPYVYAKGKQGYLYYCRKGAKPVRMRSAPGTPEFAAEYALLLRGRETRPARTVGDLIQSYRASAKWRAYAANTRKSYGYAFDYFLEAMPLADPARLKRVHVIEMRDALADTPTTANRRLAAFSVLMEHAIDKGWLPKDHNPAKGVALLETKREPREPWPPEMIAAFRAAAPPLPLLIFELLLGTGQRIGDVLRMRWDQIADGGLPVRQGKTGTGLWVPFTARLAAILEATAHDGATIVAHPNGRPVAYTTAAKWVQDVREKIGAMAWDIHALRHSAASEIAALPGMTMEHVRAITGHSSDDMARLYAGVAAQRARAQEAQEARG